MNLRLYIICIAALIAFVTPALASGMATIYGTVYNGETFEPLENAVVEVNSTPSQSMVATYGFYSFDLEPGTYTLTAKYYENNTLISSTQKTVEIKEEGKYKIALLLLPVYPEELMVSSDKNLTSRALSGNVQSNINEGNSSKNFPDQKETTSPALRYMFMALVLFSLFAGGYKLSLKSKRSDEGKSPGIKTQHRLETQHKQSFSKSFERPEASVKNSEDMEFEGAKRASTQTYPQENAQTKQLKDTKDTALPQIDEFGGSDKSGPQNSNFEYKGESATRKSNKEIISENISENINEGTHENIKAKGFKTPSQEIIGPGIEYEPEIIKAGSSQRDSITEQSIEPIMKLEPAFSNSEQILQLEKKDLTENLESKAVPEKEIRPEIKGTPETESDFQATKKDDVKPEGPIEEIEPGTSEKSLETPQEKDSLDSLENRIETDSSQLASQVKTSSPKKKAPLPSDLQEVMDIIRGQGGRITQKNLRSRLKYSEGKVSLMLADLERRELIEKFKRGRGNIVIVKDEER
ncbi:MAG: DUF7343 domain-containing protein [Methanosarcina sp.]